MKYQEIAKAARDWALKKISCRYSQAKRTQENIFDCSSLVARVGQGERRRRFGLSTTSSATSQKQSRGVNAGNPAFTPLLALGGVVHSHTLLQCNARHNGLAACHAPHT